MAGGTGGTSSAIIGGTGNAIVAEEERLSRELNAVRSAVAAPPTTSQNLADLQRRIVPTAFIASVAFGVATIVRFKEHKDNPTTVPIGTPIALLFIRPALIFVPAVPGFGR